MKYTAFILSALFIYSSCDTLSTEKPGALVPPTASQDPALPQLEITAAGHTRALHLQTFGSSENPPVFVLHGGPGSDFRLLRPLRALADSFYVVMWDSRGAGLSERVTKEELSIDSFVEEISQVKAALSPDRKVTLIGHSFGGNAMARYTGRNPGEVERLVLIEPGKLDGSIDESHNGGAVSFVDGQVFFWQNEVLTSKDHASADYKGVEVLPKSSRNWTCDGSIVDPYPFWRFGAYHYHVVQMNTFKLPNDFNWAEGMENFDGPVTILAGTCGALSEEFQGRTNLLTLPQADFQAVTGAGHLTLFTEFKEETIAAVRSVLNEESLP